MQTTERVHFRLISMPCCGFQFCNVNPRLPSYCPECGQALFGRVRSAIVFADRNAILKIDYENASNNSPRE